MMFGEISAQAGSAMTAAFLASAVEAVEALTIVLAVGTTRGWRASLAGAVAAILMLIVIVAAFGPALGYVPLDLLQFIVGVLLLLFGMRWLRKAILRAAGIISLRDEATAFAAESAELRKAGKIAGQFDWVGGAASFKAVLLEGLEVVFIVIAVGAGDRQILPAGLGAAGACVLVIAAGFIVHRPLVRVPENTLKFAVGVMLSTFGLFWTGEGLGIRWPWSDATIVGLAVLVLACALVTVSFLHRLRPEAAR